MLHWMQQVQSSTIILPPALSGYQSTPPLSPRLSISDTGALVTNGNQLQADDAGQYMITSSNYTGTLLLTISISGEWLPLLLHYCDIDNVFLISEWRSQYHSGLDGSYHSLYTAHCSLWLYSSTSTLLQANGRLVRSSCLHWPATS